MLIRAKAAFADESRIASLKIEQSDIISSLKRKDEAFSERIPRLAEIIKTRFELNDESLAKDGFLIYNINQISDAISNFFVRKGLKIAHHVPDYLDIKFKDPTKIHNKDSEEWSAQRTGNQGLDQIIGLVNRERDVISQIKNMATSDMDPTYVLLKNICKKMEEEATNRHVLLSGHAAREDYRTKVPRPRITKLKESIHWVRCDEGPLGKFEDFVEKFPPPEEYEAKWAGGFQEWGILFESIIGLKDSLTFSQWVSRIKYMVHQSKHGAAVYELVETMICDNCWDEKRQEERPGCNSEMIWDWFSPTHWTCSTCGGYRGRKRGLTREQIGDCKAPTLTRAEELINYLPGVYECLDYYITDPQKRIYARKIRLAKDLSAKS